MLCFLISNFFFRRSNFKFDLMLTLLLFSTKSTKQRSKKNTSKGFSWHLQKFPRSSYDCFTGRLALFLGQSRSAATVSCETWLAGTAKGSPCLLAMLCSTSASLPPWLSLPCPQPAASVCLYLQNATWLHQVQAQWGILHCPQVS